MTTTVSPTYPLVSDVVAFRVTRAVGDGSIEVTSPGIELVSAPPNSKLANGLLTLKGNPTGTVLASTTNSRRRVSVNLSEAAGVYDNATVTFTSGQNAGRTARVASHTSGSLELTPELTFLPGAGDRFTIARAGTERLTFKPDVPGEYTFKVYLYRENANAPQFDGDPGGAKYKTLITSETVSVHVGIVADLPIAYAAGHGITLRLKAHNATVRAAELVNPLTSEDYLASQDATVVTKLAALIGVAVATVGPDLTVKVPALRAAFEAHRILTAGSVHAAIDGTNVYVADAPTSQTESIRALNEMRRVLVGHLTGASAAGTRWHNTDDTKNVPVMPPASTLAQALPLYADVAWRGYERHRVQTATPNAHDVADNTNTLGSIDAQSDLIVAFLDFVTAKSPSVPTGASAAQVQLQTLYGYAIQ